MTGVVGDSAQVMSDCLDELRGALAGMDDRGVVERLREIESLSRRVYSVMLEAVAEVESRGLAVREGFGGTARLLSGVLRLSAAEARVRVEQAGLVGARRTLTGEVLAPRLPATAAALAGGWIGSGQLRVITETMGALPASVPEPVREQVEADLVGYAPDFDPRRLRTIARRVVATLDPDGPEPADDAPAPGVPVRGELWLRDRPDGGLGLDGWLNAEHGTMLRSLIEQLAAPTNGDDVRTAPRRQADALIELADRARTAEDFPATGGEPPHLVVHLDWDTLRTAIGAATLHGDQPIGAGDARRLACDARILPVVLGSDSEPLDVGRAQRTAPRGVRRALVARDRGCTFPGCDRPPSLCAAHHIRHWADGGSTSVANCCLLCPMHHQQVHLQGWDITIAGGRVRFHPPPILDPDRKPLTNPLRQ